MTTELEPVVPNMLPEPPPAEPAPAPEGEAPRDPRAEMMNRIAARAEEQRIREIAYGEDLTEEATARAAALGPLPGVEAAASHPPGTPPPAALTPQAAAPAAPASQEPRAAAATPPADPLQEPSRRVVEINGHHLALTDDEILQYARYGVLAANGGMQQQQPQRQEPPPAPEPLVSEDMARNFVKSLVYGDEAQAIPAVQQLIESVVIAANQRNPGVSPDAIANAAAARAAAITQQQQSLQTLGGEFTDLFQDSELAAIAGRRAGALLQHYGQTGTPKPLLDVYREACNFVRDKYMPASQPQPQDPSISTTVQAAPAPDRVARKRAAPQPPAAASRIATIPANPPAPTGSQIVQQMRKARGQTVFA